MAQGNQSKLLEIGTGPYEKDTSDEVVYRVGTLDILAVGLLLVGAFNWGFVALFGADPIGTLFGETSSFTRSIQMLIGLSSIYAVYAAYAAGRRHTPED